MKEEINGTKIGNLLITKNVNKAQKKNFFDQRLATQKEKNFKIQTDQRMSKQYSPRPNFLLQLLYSLVLLDPMEVAF